jgi:ABC-type polysaccharide/polyol phosphate export permease
VIQGQAAWFGQIFQMDSSAISGARLDADLDWPPTPSTVTQAWRDLVEGLSRAWLWTALAGQDIKLRYRGSLLGPFWITISTCIMIGAMGFIYAKLFHTDVASYMPFLTVGLILWTFVASLITEGCGTFMSVQSIVQQVAMPFSLHVYRLICRNLLVLAHSVPIIPIVLWIFHVTPDWRVVWILPAIFVISLNGVWISMFFGILSCRFRDVPPIVASFVQVVFFVTPVFWPPEALGPWRLLGELNPIFAAIDVVRAPLLGTPMAPHSWTILLLVTVVGCAGTFAVFARFRDRIAFWV